MCWLVWLLQRGPSWRLHPPLAELDIFYMASYEVATEQSKNTPRPSLQKRLGSAVTEPAGDPQPSVLLGVSRASGGAASGPKSHCSVNQICLLASPCWIFRYYWWKNYYPFLILAVYNGTSVPSSWEHRILYVTLYPRCLAIFWSGWKQMQQWYLN